MDALLPPQVLKELVKAKKALRLDAFYKVDSTKGWIKKTLVWCREHEIVLGRNDGIYVYITLDGINAIENRYRQLDYASMNEQLDAINDVNGDRVTSAKVLVYEKHARKLPTEYLVLTANFDLQMRLTYQAVYDLLDTPAQINVELDVHHLDLKCF